MRVQDEFESKTAKTIREKFLRYRPFRVGWTNWISCVINWTTKLFFWILRELCPTWKSTVCLWKNWTRTLKCSIQHTEKTPRIIGWVFLRELTVQIETPMQHTENRLRVWHYKKKYCKTDLELFGFGTWFETFTTCLLFEAILDPC